MALLELLARAAPARVVPADLVLVGDASRLDLLRRLRRGVGRIPGGLRHARRHRPSGDGRRGGLERARLVRGRAARVVESAGAAGTPAAADRPLLAVAVLALDLDLDVEDVPRELLPDVVHQLGEHLEALV